MIVGGYRRPTIFEPDDGIILEGEVA